MGDQPEVNDEMGVYWYFFYEEIALRIAR